MAPGCEATRVVRERVAFWSALAEDQDRDLTVELPDGRCAVAVDAADLSDVVDILVDNVFAHTPEGTPFRIALTREGRGAHLTVQDSGPGFDERPGQRGERVGSTGLGHQIVRRAVAGFGGDVTVDSTPGHGVRVDVLLPGALPAAPA
jgi:signal transduction histidine kinase